MKKDSITDLRNMFQANYKDTRKTLTEAVLVSILDSFRFPGVLSRNKFV